MRKISELWSVGWSFSFFMVTNRSVVLYYSKVKGVALRDALLGYNNNYLRLENDADLSPVEGLFRPSTVNENRHLYGSGDLGEVYAISLAQTLGAYSLVTDDTKQGGPYMSLLQFDDDIMPFTFADVLILRYLIGTVDENQTLSDFNAINTCSDLNWSFKSHIIKFINRFFKDPYRDEDRLWMKELASHHRIDVKLKMNLLSKIL